jgi:crossover junction endodeoxyribonuclease RusA
MSAISFFIHGMPVPQGSKRVIRGNLIEMADARLRSWRQDVAAISSQQMQGHLPWQGPVMVTLSFYLPRPKAHYGTGRNAERLKPQAPTYPSTHPDIDKLIRSVLDAMTGIVFHDDRQVVVIQAGKYYGQPGMDCEVAETVASAHDVEQQREVADGQEQEDQQPG